ncbi:sugar ABC transporter ATP-binding protein [Celeribacter persicus]|uniref:Monosaccharide ABC transporter ATP-binding protein (CUT2 family) n=1 Tax=Celeribacter persicus TaxID=1651082 RepID=A0A2T5HP58_9RHOB|nr:sugar ABC transporter ATP-binding protein [Celeribacter persicus]PTQ73346.1 monosaccharide ABC transporter ATP-binding protein (CUT2 family) [Celeribacter persicus]
MTLPLLTTHNLTKVYPGVRALDGVDFDLMPGEVHVLFGENGAGKSTLISMLAGANTPSEGKIYLDHHEVTFDSVARAKAHGVFTVFQEFSLIPTLTVAENMFLGQEPRTGLLIDHAEMRRRAQEIFDELGFPISPTAQVSSLSRAQQQMLEISKAFHGDPKVLILDEPTASLTDREVDHLFHFIDRQKAKGVGIIYISHRIQEFKRIADRITVLRDGAKIGTVEMDGTDEAALVEMMTGRAIAEIYPLISTEPGEVVLEVKDLATAGVAPSSLTLRRGEVFGVAGLVGCGKSRFFRAMMGLVPIRSGTVALKGQDITGRPTREIIRAGLYYLSPDRKHEGLDLAKTSDENLALNVVTSGASGKNGPVKRGWIDWRSVRKTVAGIATRVELPDAYRSRRVSQLSGGNQQKVLFGKAFGQEADVYIFDEPTVGVDMGTRAALYLKIKALAETGKAVVVISSDLPEAINLSHRLLIFANGRISAELPRAEASEDTVLKHFFTESEPVQ